MRGWLFLISFAAAQAQAAPELTERLPFAFNGSFSTRYGQTFDAKETEGAISFEPFLTLPFDGIRHIDFDTVIDRPTDIYQNFRVPRASLLYWQKIPSTTQWRLALLTSATALNIERWKMDGHQVRFLGAGEISRPLLSHFTFSLRVGPFYQWNGYKQTVSGSTLPTGGLQERARLVWENRDWAVDLRLLLAQSQATGWSNDYGTFEAVTYRIFPGVKLGVSHELESNVIDESTGRSRPFQLFDSRVSRISGMMELEL